jgi:chromosome partitioning protein
MANKPDPVILSCVNLKGGVGKTAIAVNFAAYCGRNGFKTLLIDLDPQTNCTFSCVTPEDWQAHSIKNGTVANLLGMRQHTSAEGKPIDPVKVIIKDVLGGKVDLIPSHLDLFTIDLDLGAAAARETLLRRAIKDVVSQYDIVICDCPPNLTIPTQNALALSTHYVIPVSPDFLSSLGISLLISRVEKFSNDLERPIQHAGIILSRVGRPSYFREQTIATLRANTTFGGRVLAAAIKERSSVSESAQRNCSIFDMHDAEATQEFTAMGSELRKALGV